MQDGRSPQGKRVCSCPTARSGRCLAACDLPRGGRDGLSVPDGALSRRVAWESRRDINIGKLFVCLDVFQESGLISYHFKEGMLNILLKPYEGKADISGSVVLATLQSMAG